MQGAGVCWLLLLLLVGTVAASTSRVRLQHNGYEGLVVAISQEVDEAEGPAIIQAIKAMVEEGSRRLYRATHRRAYFRSVRILVPKSWTNTNVSNTALAENFQDCEIRVDVMNRVYQHQPYTLQTGGCGDPGHYIHLTPQYLTNHKHAAWWGPRGKVLLMEWAKLRWGVFDELGYPGDATFPLFYVHDQESQMPGSGVLLPTHCANQLVEGRRIDRTGRSACGMTERGEPDQNCRFVPYKDQQATSSLMSYPFIFSDSVTDFCGDAGSEHPHNSAAPTKQNLFCEGRSVWDVMMQHPDFANGANPPTDEYRSPEVEVVQHADANYALVLDYSGSMNDHYRIHKLRKTARRWLLQEVATGSHVAIVRFSRNARLVHQLIEVRDEASRRALADSLGSSADGGTSIGAGLYVAVKKILANRPNPVILLITDGEENENPRINDILQNVIDSGVRVITVAFGSEADPQLEKVADITGGKTFTVNDVDEGEMLEDAFVGALTYQPPPSRANTTVTILDTVYRGTEQSTGSNFSVDFTVGRNLVLRLDTDDPIHITSPPTLVRPSGSQGPPAIYDHNTFSWIVHVPMAEEGEWRWQVGLSGMQDKFVRAKVTAQTRNPEVHPITTRAWVSSGAQDVNATTDRVIIYAEVKQGNNPVVGADVRALVTPPQETQPSEQYQLLDNGQGADTTAGDGIYSRYMTRYTSTGRYSVKAQVTDGGGAVINRGFLTSPQRRRRSITDDDYYYYNHSEDDYDEYDPDYDSEDDDRFAGRPDLCCGSVVPTDHTTSTPTGTFHREIGGGSIKVTEVPPTDHDNIPPSAVRDLQVKVLLAHNAAATPYTHNLTFTWTAPGDDLDSGTVTSYILRMSMDHNELTKDSFDDDHKNGTLNTTGLPLEPAGSQVSLTLPFTLIPDLNTYFALKAVDDVGQKSLVSNIVTVREVKEQPLDTTLPPPFTAQPLPTPGPTGQVPLWAVFLILVVVVFLVVVALVVVCSWKQLKKDEYKCVAV